jgi:hypothetical protein
MLSCAIAELETRVFAKDFRTEQCWMAAGGNFRMTENAKKKRLLAKF